MPVPDVLPRGSVCLALYPFVPGLPLRQVAGSVDAAGPVVDRHDDLTSLTAAISPGAPPTDIVIQFKLRRVLLLQTVRGRRPDVVVARINSITPERRARSGWYLRLTEGRHPAHYLIGRLRRHGSAGKEAFVDLMNVTTIRTDVIVRRTGYLTADEMRDVSERLVRTLELDISRLVDGGG